MQHLLALLPEQWVSCIENVQDATEFILDLDRPLEVRYGREKVFFDDLVVNEEILKHATDQLSDFGPDNRAGINRTLHRISRLESRTGRTVGLTCRAGKVFEGCVAIIADLIESEKSVLLLGAPGLGKAQPITSKVLTPTGWRLMGAITVGDKVLGVDGKPHMVTGVFPQGELPVMRVVFDDLSSTRCCSEHLWEVTTRNARVRSTRHKKPVVSEVLRLQDMLPNIVIEKGHARRNYATPTITPCLFDPQDLPLDPYLLGVLLGDGCLSNNCRLATADSDVLESVRSLLPPGVYCDHVKNYDYVFTTREVTNTRINTLKTILRGLGVMNQTSSAKFVPPPYLLGTPDQRLALLQGLLDTDGTVDKKSGSVSFSSSSPHLVESVMFIVRSLGGKSSCHSKKTSGLPNTNVRVSLPPYLPPFRLNRKLALLKPERQERYLQRYIDSVEEAGVEECVCLQVDSPRHLYVTDDFIVTHNTTKLRDVCRFASTELGRSVVIVDTSNEIAGDGDLVHPTVGRSRRLQVPNHKSQHAVMQEAVENHTPEVLVIDEIGNQDEAEACRTFAQRGVQLIATAHGKVLEDLMDNPVLKDLIGGIKSVTLGDERAENLGVQKTQRERVGPPTFSVLVELIDYNTVAVHHDIAASVDCLLKGGEIFPEIREYLSTGDWDITRPERLVLKNGSSGEERPKRAPWQKPGRNSRDKRRKPRYN